MTTPTKAMTDETRRLTREQSLEILCDVQGTLVRYMAHDLAMLLGHVIDQLRASALEPELRSEGREDAAPVCPECYGTGRTDNHVTGEVECFHCEGAGTIDTAAPDEAREYVSVPREPTMGQWDDFCSVHHVPFDKFMAAYKAMLAAPPAPNRDAEDARLRALLEGLQCENIDALMNGPTNPEILRAVGKEIRIAAQLGSDLYRARNAALAAAPEVTK